MSAPRSSRTSAVARCPPRQACQNAFVICWSTGDGSAVQHSRTRSTNPSAAACQRVVVAPRSSNRCAAFHCANTTASDIGVPPVCTAPGASMSAPASRSASRTAISLLLAAQCSAVSGGPAASECTTRAFTSAPNSTSTRTTSAPLGKCPGQSATMCRSVRDTPRSSTTRAAASVGLSRSLRCNVSTSPLRIAAAIETAR